MDFRSILKVYILKSLIVEISFGICVDFLILKAENLLILRLISSFIRKV